MLDQLDGRTFPKIGVLNVEVIPVEPQKMPHRPEGGSFVALLERVRLGNSRQQSNCEHDDVFFTVSECILRACQCAFEQTDIAKKVPLPGFLDL